MSTSEMCEKQTLSFRNRLSFVGATLSGNLMRADSAQHHRNLLPYSEWSKCRQ